MVKVALTGGTGFVGRALIDLMSPHSKMRCVARDVEAATRTVAPGQVEWIAGDLGSDDWQSRLVDGCDAVVHSGLYRTTASFQGEEADIVEYLRVNFLGTIKLIEAAVAAQVERFVFVSTCAVHQRILDDRALDEAHPLWAENHYGAHKAALEKFVHSYGFSNKIKIVAIRPTGIYGVANPVQQSKWYELICNVADGTDVTVSSGGKEVHVADVAKAIKLLLGSDAKIAGEAFACFDKYISEFEVATLTKEITASNSQIIGNPKSPKHQIETGKIRRLGMQFGGKDLLRQTIEQILEQRKPDG